MRNNEGRRSGNEIDADALFDVWQMFHRERGCSVDRMLCSPKFRNEFLEAARQVLGVSDEETILWALVGLRKKKVLSRADQ
jgi:hypothetical protein